MASHEVALLPCPFCGSAADYNRYGYYHKGDEQQEIRCSNSQCKVKPGVVQNQEEYGEWDIVEAWNIRTPIPTMKGGEHERG